MTALPGRAYLFDRYIYGGGGNLQRPRIIVTTRWCMVLFEFDVQPTLELSRREWIFCARNVSNSHEVHLVRSSTPASSICNFERLQSHLEIRKRSRLRHTSRLDIALQWWSCFRTLLLSTTSSPALEKGGNPHRQKKLAQSRQFV